MTLSDLTKLIRHYIKIIIVIPIICMVLAVAFSLLLPPTYRAKATLLTSGDIALASGFAQNEAEIYSQNNIEVSTSTEAAYRTITITAEGKDYGGCIAAANATVLAAAEDYRKANSQVSISTNEATFAESITQGITKTVLISLVAGLFIVICAVALIDAKKMPIKSRRDIEIASGLPVVGNVPTRDRGERLLANVRFLDDNQPSTIAVVPVGFTGATLTCAELASAFEYVGTPVTRIKGNPHAQGLNTVSLPGITTIIECAPLSEGMGAIYIAKEADITLLCASAWRDSRKSLISLVEELRFAKVNIGGVIFITVGYSEEGTL